METELKRRMTELEHFRLRDALRQGALERILRERDEARAELRAVDEALSRRPALADAPNRYVAIERACNVAGKSDVLQSQVTRLVEALKVAHLAHTNCDSCNKGRALLAELEGK